MIRTEYVMVTEYGAGFQVCETTSGYQYIFEPISNGIYECTINYIVHPISLTMYRLRNRLASDDQIWSSVRGLHEPRPS